MVTIHDKGSDNIRLMSGSCYMMTKKTLIWVSMCKEKRKKNSGKSDFRHRHPGITGTYDLLGRMYTWRNMRTYVEDYVHGCTTCTKAKKKNTKAHGKLQPLPNPMTPWHWTESDLVRPLPSSKGKDAIYMVVNRFTKYACFVPCNTTEMACSLAHLHTKHVWAHKGLPQVHSFD